MILHGAVIAGGLAQGGSGNPGADSRIKPAAHGFEACLMKEFLEPLQHDALFADGEKNENADDSGSALISLGSEALAKEISERGGFGIAEKIIGHLEKQYPESH